MRKIEQGYRVVRSSNRHQVLAEFYGPDASNDAAAWVSTEGLHVYGRDLTTEATTREVLEVHTRDEYGDDVIAYYPTTTTTNGGIPPMASTSEKAQAQQDGRELGIALAAVIGISADGSNFQALSTLGQLFAQRLYGYGDMDRGLVFVNGFAEGFRSTSQKTAIDAPTP